MFPWSAPPSAAPNGEVFSKKLFLIVYIEPWKRHKFHENVWRIIEFISLYGTSSPLAVKNVLGILLLNHPRAAGGRGRMWCCERNSVLRMRSFVWENIMSLSVAGANFDNLWSKKMKNSRSYGNFMEFELVKLLGDDFTSDSLRPWQRFIMYLRPDLPKRY